MQQSHREQPDYQPEPQQDTSDRPPQFNGSYCPYPSGEGSCEAGEGEGEDSDGGGSESSRNSAENTLVGDPTQNARMQRTPWKGNFVVAGTPRPEHLPVWGEIERHHGLVILTMFDEFVVVARNTSSSRLPHIQSWESLMPEYSSGIWSSRTSNGTRTRSAPSPRSPGRGLGTWIGDEEPLHGLPLEYYFLHPPLRLSPQDGLDEGISQEAAALWQFIEMFDRGRGERVV